MFCNPQKRTKKFMDTHKEAKIIHQVYDKDGGAALILHQKVYVFVNNFHFFLCYFRTTVVLRFFEYLPKCSFEIKLDGTYNKFTVALRLCHIYFLY